MTTQSAQGLEGQVLAGKYRVERVLGEGGMGVVVQALDEALQRPVAIKFLLPQYVRNPEACERFLREARAAVRIQSEHVARIIDVGSMADGAPYMVMEFLEGSDLAAVVRERGRVSPEEACLYLIQACEAIAEAHAQGIIHRDLKPANLYLATGAGGGRKIKVLDFGISKVTECPLSRSGASLTQTSATMGSPLYMSPEQLRSTRDVDPRTDIWSLGVILYELLCGEVPFSGDSVAELSTRILLDPPTPITKHIAGLPPGLIHAVNKTLQKDPEARFATVGELARTLVEFAPQRARGNVERIVRVLGAAGMSTEDFQASEAPDTSARAALGTARVDGLGKTNPAFCETEVAFGSTQKDLGPPKRHSLARLGFAASGFGLALGIAWALRPSPRPSQGLEGATHTAAASNPPAPHQPTRQPTATSLPAVRNLPAESPSPPSSPRDPAGPSQFAQKKTREAPSEPPPAVRGDGRPSKVDPGDERPPATHPTPGRKPPPRSDTGQRARTGG